MKSLLPTLALFPALCFGNETNPAWTRAFFSDRFELRLEPPSAEGQKLRWSADGLTPRATAPAWHGPLVFAETTQFRAQVFSGTDRVGEPQARTLIRLAPAPLAGTVEGLWSRRPGEPWKAIAAPADAASGSLAAGVLHVPEAGLLEVSLTPGTRLSLGQFTFAGEAASPGPFWIEAGAYALVVESAAEAAGSVRFNPVGNSRAAPVFCRPPAAPAPLFACAEKETALAADGFHSTAWTVPQVDEDRAFALNFAEPLEGALVFATDPGLRRFPATLRLPDGKALSPVLVGRGLFHASLPSRLPTLSLVQAGGAPEWTLFEVTHQPADDRPFTTFALNCLPGQDVASLPDLERLAALTRDLWPRFATAARHPAGAFPRQLWLGAVATQAEPVRVMGRHFLISREALAKPETAALLAQKLGELAARPVGDTPPDIAQGLGAGVVLLTLGQGPKLEGGATFPLPQSERGRRTALAALEKPDAFHQLLRAARTSFDGSVWKQFEDAALNRKPTEK